MRALMVSFSWLQATSVNWTVSTKNSYFHFYFIVVSYDYSFEIFSGEPLLPKYNDFCCFILDLYFISVTA